MKLTQALFKWKPNFIGKIIKIRGSALKGKHKFVPPATRATRYMLWLKWRSEEEAMKYLSKPFVSEEQELNYLESINQKHHDIDPLYTSKLQEPMRQRYAVEILEKFERTRKHELWD